MPADTSQIETSGGAPRAVLLLPIVFAFHVAEEWFGGFLEWTPTILGFEISVERFLIINAVGLVVAIVGSVASVRSARFAWFAVTLASLLGLNGVLHALATLGFATYSPGVITGLLCFPLSIIILRRSAEDLPKRIFSISILGGILLQALVTAIAATG